MKQRHTIIGVLILVVLLVLAGVLHAWVEANAKYRERFLRAERLTADKKEAEAADIYESLAQTDWPVADLAAARLRDQAEKRDNDEAVFYWNQRIVDRFPNSRFRPQAMLDAADYDLAHGQANRALAALDRFLREYPQRDAARVFFLRGQALEALDRTEEAIVSYGQSAFWYTGQHAELAEIRLDQLQANGREIAYPPPEEIWGRIAANFIGASYVTAEALALRFAAYYPESRDAFRARLIAVDALLARRKTKEARVQLEALTRAANSRQDRAAVMVRLAKVNESYSEDKKRSFYVLAAEMPEGSGARTDGLLALFQQDWNANRFGSAAKYGEQALAEGGHYLLDPADLRWRTSLAWYLAGDYDGAERGLRQFLSSYPEHDRTLGAWYWLGRAQENQKKKAEARKSYEQCMVQRRWSYYGQLAEARLAEQGVPADRLLSSTDASAANAPLIKSEWEQADGGGTRLDAGARRAIDHYATQGPERLRAAFSALRELREMGLYSEAKSRLDFVKDDLYATPEGPYFLSIGYALAGDSRWSILAGGRGLLHVQQGKLRDPDGLLLNRVYPMLHADLIQQGARNHGLDPLLVFALIKQESAFQADARSWVGAAGLMQVMPSTGRTIARRRGIRHFQPSSLYRPEVGVDFGCWELAHLMRQSGGDIAASLAGYNAGYGRPQRWWPQHYSRSYDEMLELIPLTETRDYVKTIFLNYEMYQRLYRDDPTVPGRRPSEMRQLFQKVRPLAS